MTVVVDMTVRQWQYIDASMDNEISTEAVVGDPKGVVNLAQSVRQVGWDHVATSDGWPPGHELVSVTLTRSQWNLALETLNRWEPRASDVDDVESATRGDIEEMRNLRELITASLRAAP